jgi:hypothetical protein
MPILSIQSGQSGLTAVRPAVAYIDTSDTIGAVLTAGYLNQSVQSGLTSFSLPCIAAVSTIASAGALPDVGWYEVTYANGNWSLSSTVSPGDVALPTITNHIAVYTNTTGGLGEDATTAINGGNIQAGLSGTAGAIASFPATALKGSLNLVAVANTGNTATTISNAAMGQASVVTIPDPASATANFAVAPAALVNGNLVQASGVAGLVADAGLATTNVVSNIAANTFTGSGQIILAKANGTEASNAVTASGNAGVITTSSLSTAGGSTYAITWTNTKITSTSVILLSIMGGTNTTKNITMTATAGTGTSTLTIYNNTASTALNGTIFIGYTVL